MVPTSSHRPQPDVTRSSPCGRHPSCFGCRSSCPRIAPGMLLAAGQWAKLMQTMLWVPLRHASIFPSIPESSLGNPLALTLSSAVLLQHSLAWLEVLLRGGEAVSASHVCVGAVDSS